MALHTPARQRVSLASFSKLMAVGPVLLAAGLLTGCNSDDDGGPPPVFTPGDTLSSVSTEGGDDNIVALPSSIDSRITAVFDRYTEFEAPNGGRIHFLSQDAVSDDLLIRVRGLVRQHLLDEPGSALGADKTAALNVAANNEATFVLFENAAAYDAADADVMAFQDLFGDRLGELDASTVVQEGSPSYTQASPTYDPSIRATLLFALEQGIAPGIPAFQTNLETAAANAVTNNIYDPGTTPADEVDEEYLVVVLDTYYGLYGHDPNGNGTGGLNGEYMAFDRATVESADPDGFALIESFFRPTHRYSAFLDPAFNGTFLSTFDVAVPYTHRSQYLERIGIRIPSTATVNGNELDNILLGNDLDTVFEGGPGDDLIEAEFGNDMAVYSGNVEEYVLTDIGSNATEVMDTVPDRDGTDVVRGITQLVFANRTVNL